MSISDGVMPLFELRIYFSPTSFVILSSDFNLLGTVGDLYCFSNTFSMLVDLVTLTLKFDLLLKNFSLGHNFQTRRARVFMLHMCIPCDKTFHIIP